MTLNISTKLQLPVEFLSLRKVVYGGSGAGKTSFGRVIFEEATVAGVPCGAIDLKGDWYGLKSSRTGNSDGIPVIIFGGEHADVPIDENGGAELAEIVAELRQPFVIDLEELSKTKQLKFLAPFFDRLYDKNREALVLNCDEADRYIPQRIISKDPNAAICLGAGEDIAKRGRKHGIFPIFFSQRNADLNKSVTELCDVAIVFRTSGPNDQKAVNDWFLAKGNLVTEEQRLEVMHSIAALDNGEAIICSAHPHLPMFERVQIRLPRTFDSSATPEIGKQLIKPKKLAHVEISALNERMQSAIEKAKANDPAELRKEISKLKAELQRAQKQQPEAKPVEVPMLSKEDLKKIADVHEFFRDLKSAADRSWDTACKIQIDLEAIRRTVEAKLKQPVKHAFPVFTVKPTSKTARTAPDSGNGELRGGPLQVMKAVAQYPEGISTETIAVLTGYKATSRYEFLRQLKSSGYVDESSGKYFPTDAGMDALGSNYEPLPTGHALLEHWRQRLTGGEAKVFEAAISMYPNSLSSEQIQEATGFKATSVYEYARLLKARRLLKDSGRGSVIANMELFQ